MSTPAAADGYDELLNRIDAAGSVSESVVKTFNDQTALLRTVDRQMGSASLVDQMQGHLAALEDTLNFAVLPTARRLVALALAGASTLAAWAAIDSGAIERAWRHYELAKRAARDAEAPMYLAHAMAEQAYVLCAAGRPTLGGELVRDAQRTLAEPDLLDFGHGCMPPKRSSAPTLACPTTADEPLSQPRRSFRQLRRTATWTC